MVDSRLLGSWKSDKQRTALEVGARNDIEPGKREKLLSLFGKLELRYTRGRCTSFLNGETTVRTYRVVAKNTDSVVVVSESPVAGQMISHLHFEGSEFYWITVNGRFREYFRRISE